MKTLDRKPLPKTSTLSQLALMEQQAWMAELTARKAVRPIPTQPAWAAPIHS